MADETWSNEILPVLAPRLAVRIARATSSTPFAVEEIRLREGRPLHLVCSDEDRFVTDQAMLCYDPDQGLNLTREDLHRTFQMMAQGSVYAWEDEVRSGFLTLSGGHRVGLAGKVVTDSGRIRTLKHVTALNVRIAREITGCSTDLLGRLISNGRLVSTLLISPPGAGKTTMLRDLIRQVSRGLPQIGLKGSKVGVVDERSELAGCIEGVPQRDLGPRTDVLDGCPKADGIMMLIRSMSPQVVAVDEIGRLADADAAMEALHAGVSLLATAHGWGLSDVSRRPALSHLISAGAFERVAVLGRSRGPGTVEQVLDLRTGGATRAG